MGRRIRWLGIVLIVLFGVVLFQLGNIQFHKAGALASDPKNPNSMKPNAAATPPKLRWYGLPSLVIRRYLRTMQTIIVQKAETNGPSAM